MYRPVRGLLPKGFSPSWLVAGPVALAGLATVVWALAHLPADRFVELVVFIGLAAASQRVSISLFRSSSISVAFAVAVAALVALGPAAAIVVQLAPGLVSSVVPHVKPPRKIVFNATSLPLQTWLASVAYVGLGGAIGSDALAWSLLVPTAAATAVFVVANIIGLTSVIALDTGAPPASIWRTNYRWLLPNYAGLGAVGLGMGVAVQALGLSVVLVFAIPLVTAWYSFHLYMDQTTQVRRRNDELEAARAAIEASEAQYKSLAEAIPQIVWTARADGGFDYWNNRWYEYSGLSRGEDESLSLDPVLHPDDIEISRAHWEQVIRTGEIFEIEHRLRRANDGAYRWHLSRALPLRDQHGCVVRWFGTCTDIDDQKRAVEQTERAVRLRDEFLSVAAHELKTPIAGLRLGVEVAIQRIQRSAPEQSELVSRPLQSVVSQSDKLTRLVGRLLDVSRLELNKLMLERQDADIVAIVRQEVASIQALSPRHQIRTIAPDQATACVDALRLSQVVSNLLDNAVKFSPAGGAVEVVVEHQPASHVRVAVRDWGLGIEPEHRPHVFTRLYQAHGGSHQSGMGLGLYVSRQIAELHGGTLGVEFPSDRGTCFVLEIPTKSPSSPEVDGVALGEDARAG